jgi:CRP-like cAMP-binding protein
VSIDPVPASIAAGAWFGRLSAPFRAALLADARMLHLAEGAPIFWRGDAADGLYAVVEGAVAIGAVDADGHAAMLTHIQPGMWFGEIALLDGRPRTHDAQAARESRLLHVPVAPLRARLDRDPAWWRELAWLTTEKLRLAFQVTEAAALMSAPQRVAARLTMMADGYGGTGARQPTLWLSQEQLAAMLSLSRQTINRILKRFEAAGLIALGQARIEVIDGAGLAAVRDASGRE